MTPRHEPSRRPPSRDERGRVLSTAAVRQSGVVSLDQLLAIGYSRREIAHIARRGLLHRIHLGVYAVGHPALSDRGRLVAALLTVPPDAFLSHFTAAGLWQLRPLGTGIIHLTVPGAGRTHHRAGVVVHRTRHPPHPAEIRRHDGMRVSAVARLLVEVSPLTTQRHLERLITESVRHRRFDLSEIEATLARHPHRPGIRCLKRALRGYRQPVASGWEEDFRDWLMEDPRVPEPECDVIVHGWELDFYWPALRFAIDLDSNRWHSSVFDMEKDRLKDTQLQLHDIRVMRVGELRWGEARAAIRGDVNRFLGLS